MENKVFVITDVASDIGKALARSLAQTGEVLVLVAPEAEQGNDILKDMRLATQNFNISLELCDLSVLSSVRNLAEILKSKYSKVDVLINHAGSYKPKREISVDGYEKMFAANYLGPFLLTNLLLESLQAAVQANGSARVLNIIAPSTTPIDLQDLQSEKNFNSVHSYAAARTASLLFTLALARRLETTGITVNAIYPGSLKKSFAPLQLFRWLKSGSASQASGNIMQAVVGPEFEKTTGKFLQEGNGIEVPAFVHDLSVQQRLWEMSEEMTQLTLTKGEMPINDPHLEQNNSR